MLSPSLKSVFPPLCWLVLLITGCFAQTAPLDPSEGLRIEIPAGGQIRIENQFGEIAAEVWKENYVSVSAINTGAAPLKRSPVVIENRNKLLAISIARRVTDPFVAVRLAVKIPETAHVEIIAGKNRTTMRGMPSSALVKSGSGDVAVTFVGSPNADITARSISGSVKSELPQLLTESGHVLQARVGTGAQTLRINSQSGSIILTEVDEPRKTAANDKALRDSSPLEPSTKAAGIPAPISDTQEIGEGDIIRVDAQLVNLNMSVIDRNTNRGLVGLTKSDFRLFENGTEQQILQFESSSAPFDLVLLIDLSGSTRDKVKLIRAAALRFINAARPYDRIGIVTFAGHPELISPLTLDRQSLRQRANAMDTDNTGDTKLYDATDFAARQLLQETKNARRSAIVLMSDGLDGSIDGVQGDGSKLLYQDLLNRIQEFDGVLYTLWLDTFYEALHPRDTQPEAFESGYDRMKQMADQGGGIFYEVERLEDLAGAYERVVADLGTVYSLAYRPADKVRDGKWRAIRVNVDRPAAIARGKRGYYAN